MKAVLQIIETMLHFIHITPSYHLLYRYIYILNHYHVIYLIDALEDFTIIYPFYLFL